MLKLEGKDIFARVAEAKSFSAAARRLGISKSLVSKEVSKLEKALGGVLKCTAPVAFATLHIARAIPEFHDCVVYTHATGARARKSPTPCPGRRRT